MKTSELIGATLDWAVAKCEDHYHRNGTTVFLNDFVFQPSTDWSQAGPIIEREKLFIVAPYKSATGWKAYKMEDDTELPCWLEDGPTPLIAAMRCLVASKLGDEVEIPEELK